MEFELKTEEIKINNAVYKIRPLTGRFLPKLYTIINKFEGIKENATPAEIMSSFDAEAVAILHELCLETLKKSYPNTPADTLDEFVSQNLLQMFEGILHVNIRAPDNATRA